jgi:Mn2+/Fe2+ NRAMP family transporter
MAASVGGLGDIKLPWGFIVFGLIVCLALGWQTAKAIGTGEMPMRGGWVIRRDENPRLFWCTVTASIPMLVICTWLGLLGLGRHFGLL